MSGPIIAYGSLGLAIICEVIGTTALKASDEFTRLGPTLLMVVSYLCSFYLLAIVMRSIPVGIAYAIWSGLGIVLVTTLGYVLFKQRLDLPAYIGLGLIIAGVIVINLFSKSGGH